MFRIWEATKLGLTAWAVAGTIGYFLYIRPKWYPKIEYSKAQTFSPKEIEDWNRVGAQQQQQRVEATRR